MATESEFRGNWAWNHGGVFYFDGFTDVLLDRIEFIDNYASQGGSVLYASDGAYLSDGMIQIVDSSFEGNWAGTSALARLEKVQVAIENSIFVDNYAA